MRNKKKIYIIIAAALVLAGLITAGILVLKGRTGRETDDTAGSDTQVSRDTVLDFYVINDLHGKFDDSTGQPGVDELTTYLKERVMIGENTVFLSSGDMWQGSSESNLTQGRIVIDWMNELGFVSMTLGNHEFDWGEEVISDNAELAEFPFLAINVYSRDTMEQVPYCQSSVMVERGGIKIGIIGAIGDCYSSISAEQSGGFYIIAGDELTELVKAESLKLRSEGADIIVYSLHDGYSDSFGTEKVLADSRLASYYDTALSDGYVDLVFEGHTHQSYVIVDTKGVYHLQDGGENDGISHVRVSVAAGMSGTAGTDGAAGAAGTAGTAGTDSASGTHGSSVSSVTVTLAEIVSSGYYGRRDSDSLRDELLEKYADEISFTKDVIGQNYEYRDRNELREIVAQLYFEKGNAKWGHDYNIVLGGGFLSVRDQKCLPAGDVTYGQLQSLFPFDNELVLCSCSGADLERVFFESMNDNYFMYTGSWGEEVLDNWSEYRAKWLTETFYVVVDTYTSTYEPNNLTEVARYGEELYARDLLAEYFSEGESAEDYFSRHPESFPVIDSSTARKPITTAIYEHLIVTQVSEEERALTTAPLCSKTHGAWLNLADGIADLVFLVLPTDEELEYLRERDVAIDVKMYGCDGLAFTVSKDAPVKELTTEQIKGIFEGTITNWSELGGPDHAIHPFIRNEQSGSQRLFESLMWPDGDVPDFAAKLDSDFDFCYIEYEDMGSIVVATHDDPYAIGYNIVSYIDNEFYDYIDLVTVDGAYPDTEHFADRSYPFTTEAYVAIRADEPEGSPARILFDWVGSEDFDFIAMRNSSLSLVHGEVRTIN